MNDLVTTAILLAACSAMLAWAGDRAARRLSRRASNLLAVAVLAFAVIFTWRWAHRTVLARLVPHPGAVVLADAALPATALLAGLAWGRLAGSAARRAALVVPLVLLAGYRTFGPLAGDAPPLSDRWRRGVCVQTSAASCGAAAAATLLRAHGIDASEPEMAGLCLTRAGGTPTLGIYRGLVLKTTGTPWRVVPISGADAASIRAAGLPALLAVGLPRDRRGLDPRYEAQWGWTPGVRHTVVLFAFTGDGRAEVGDPAVGREHWSAADLHVLWGGDGFRLVRR